MEDTSVIPDSNSVDVGPSESDLYAVVLNQKAGEVVLKGARLLSSQAVDLLAVGAESVDGLPAGKWVGADDWVLGGSSSRTFSGAPRSAE